MGDFNLQPEGASTLGAGGGSLSVKLEEKTSLKPKARIVKCNGVAAASHAYPQANHSKITMHFFVATRLALDQITLANKLQSALQNVKSVLLCSTFRYHAERNEAPPNLT